MKPTYKLYDYEPTKIPNYLIYSARLTCKCTHDDLQNIIGDIIHDKTVVSVEAFAKYNQDYESIGLAVNDN